MKYLLDTNIVIMWLREEASVGKNIREIIRDPQNLILLSSVSIWEIAIKRSKKKLKITKEYYSILIEEDFTPLHITPEHAHHVEKLPFHHGDPFDRLLIAQGIIENATILSTDHLFDKYDVPVIYR